MTAKSVLVTGSSGLVGSAIARELDAAGWSVRGHDLLPGAWTHHQGDIRDARAAVRAVAGVDAVVHTAALHAPHVGQKSEREFRSTNVDATQELLDRADRCGVNRFLLTSSTSVYGEALVPTDRAVWVTEDITPRPRDIYDETKLEAETRTFSAPLSTAVLRIARCFPEPVGVRAAHRLYRGVAVEDVARAHRLALRHPGAESTANISGPTPFQRSDVQQLWEDAAEVVEVRAPDLARLFHQRGWSLPSRIDRVYDSALAGNAIGYSPIHGVCSLSSQMKSIVDRCD